MVSTLDSGTRGLGSSPGRCLLFFAKTLHFHRTKFSSQEYMTTSELSWQLDANMLWGFCDGLASHPGEYCSDTPSSGRFMLWKPELRHRPDKV